MKTIREGRTQPNHRWIGTVIKCNNCGFSGELEFNDKVVFVQDQRDGDYYEVRCPNCKNVMTLASSICR